MALPRLPFEAAPVDVIERPTVEELARRRHRGPILLKGCLDDWPILDALRGAATGEAKLAHLGELMRGPDVAFTRIAPEQRGHLGFTDDLRRPNFRFDSGGQVPFDEFRRCVLASLEQRSKDAVYMQAAQIAPFPRLVAEVGVLPYLDARESRRSRIWIGSGGQVVNLHHDHYLNFMCMLEGTKRVTLLPYDALPDVYPSPRDRGSSSAPSSFVRLLEPDFERFPRLRDALARARVAELEPGDVLCVPPLYWHHVESFGLNVMVNTWAFDLGEELIPRFYENGFEAMAFARHLAPEARERLARIYAATAFAAEPARFLDDRALDHAMPADRIARVLAHLRATLDLRAKLPRHWQEAQETFFDYYVFQRHGPPLPSLPGAFDAMVDRMTRSRASPYANARPALCCGPWYEDPARDPAA